MSGLQDSAASVSSYSMVETNYNIVFGIIGLLIMSVFGGGSLI